MDFETLGYEQALGAIPDRAATWLAENAAFYHGDHWQGGAGWTGPRLAATHALYAETWATIQSSFVSSNKIREVVRREVMAAVGDAPAWSLTPRRALPPDGQPSAEEQALIAEGMALVRDWWDQRQMQSLLEEMVAMAAWGGRGVLRLFVPPGLLVDGVLPQAGSLAEGLAAIQVHCPEPSMAAVAIDPRTRAEVGVYAYTEEVDGQQVGRCELVYLSGGAGERGSGGDSSTALRSAQNDKLTVLRVMGPDGRDVQEPGVLNLGGRLTMHEIRRPVLVSEQVRSLQKGINKTLTMMDRNGTQGGFLERIVTNAQLPGKMVPDPDHPGLTKWAPEPMHLGPGTTNFLAGVVVRDAEGNESIATPGVHYRDPVSPTTFIETKEALYRALLEEVQQVHVLLADAGSASGESRRQARAEFEQAVRLSASLAEDALRWLVESVLAMASLFAGQPGYFESLRASAEAHVNLGPVSADEVRVNAEQVAADLLSPETAMARNGVRDVPAELERIAAAKAARAELASMMLEAARAEFDKGGGSVA